MATTTTTTTTTIARDPQAGDHAHGTMDARSHERTFEGFVRFMAWNAVACIVILVFLALVNA